MSIEEEKMQSMYEQPHPYESLVKIQQEELPSLMSSVNHILESGANEIRIIEMIELFLGQRERNRIEELEKAMQWFVDRCDKGEVRSKRTYARFKELLNSKTIC